MQKCICDNPGFCNYFQIEMTLDPPNWQWCQKACPLEREAFFNELFTHPRIIFKSNDNDYAPVRYFFDRLPQQKNDIAICIIAANSIALEQLNITRKQLIKYANKCRADYIELSGDQFPEYPMYNKYRLYQITSKYEKTLYLDCDIIVKDNCPNLFKITPDDKISGYNQNNILKINDEIKGTNYHQEMKTDTEKIARYFDINISDYIQPNGGVLIIPKLLSNLYKQPIKPYIKTWCFDQYYLSCHLNKSNFYDIDELFNWEYIRHNFWDHLNDSYIIHADGSRPHSYRLKLLSNLIEKNYSYFPPPNPELNSGHDGWRPVWFVETAQ